MTYCVVCRNTGKDLATGDTCWCVLQSEEEMTKLEFTACPRCGGSGGSSGQADNLDMDECTYCRGEGKVPIRPAPVDLAVTLTTLTTHRHQSGDVHVDLRMKVKAGFYPASLDALTGVSDLDLLRALVADLEEGQP